jgi:DUF1365 family protein
MSDVGVSGCSLYFGRVRHQRSTPRRHAFSYRLFLVGLDLDRVEEAMQVSPWLGYERFAHSSFRRRDYFGDPQVPLDEAVRAHVEAETGRRPTGPIELVTQLRTFGYSFNPVTFYYCWTTDRSQLEAVVAEITNTPWGERHAYVLPWPALADADAPTRRSHRWQFRKSFHISPFSPMELEHDWRFAQPGKRLGVHMMNRAASGTEFEATLLMDRQPFTRRNVHRALRRHPFMPGKTLLGIYWQALKLFVKRAPFHTHPAKRPDQLPESR